MEQIFHTFIILSSRSTMKGGVNLRFSVAIDGPAGSGKSTVAKMIAEKFDLRYINTGAMYRAVALLAIRNHISSTNVSELCDLVDSLSMHFENNHLIVNEEDVTNEINSPAISNEVAAYAAIGEIRKKVVCLQQKMAEKYNVIMDGRDIGTHVLKDAPFKFYLTASPETRAKRRYDELISKGTSVNYKDILESIINRDFADSNRKASPLKKAEDAIEIDSSNLNANEVVDCISNYINQHLSS